MGLAETLIRPCPACRGSGERSTYRREANCRCRPGSAHSHEPCPTCEGSGYGLEDPHG